MARLAGYPATNYDFCSLPRGRKRAGAALVSSNDQGYIWYYDFGDDMVGLAFRMIELGFDHVVCAPGSLKGQAIFMQVTRETI